MKKSITDSFAEGLSLGIAGCNVEFRLRIQHIYSELNNLNRINKSDMKQSLYDHTKQDLGEDINPDLEDDVT